jgi:crossover junction endodeoxyribonuclease RusA
VIVTLPWPHKGLSPNARKHWAALASAKKKARADAHYATLEAAGSRLSAVREALAGEGPLPVTVRFFPPDKRRRDDDNQVASFKAARDGIAEALGVDDRRFRPHYFFEDAAKPGRVEIVIPEQLALLRGIRSEESPFSINGPPQ